MARGPRCGCPRGSLANVGTQEACEGQTGRGRLPGGCRSPGGRRGRWVAARPEAGEPRGPGFGP